MTKRTKKITEADLTAMLVAVLEAELSEFINPNHRALADQ